MGMTVDLQRPSEQMFVVDFAWTLCDSCSKVTSHHMDKFHFKGITQGETVKLKKPKHFVTLKPTLVINSY